MKDLLPLGEKIGARLKARKETIVVAESSTGGLVSAALLAVPGASAYFIGGGAFYTRQSFLALRETGEQMFAGKRGCTDAWALMLARTLRERCNATWAIGESGPAAPLSPMAQVAPQRSRRVRASMSAQASVQPRFPAYICSFVSRSARNDVRV